MLMRPKSSATVVVVFDATIEPSSTPVDTDVMAASVVRGRTSDTAPMKVVLPTPKPPATTNFTAATCSATDCPSESTDTLDQPFQHRQRHDRGGAAMDEEHVVVEQ